MLRFIANHHRGITEILSQQEFLHILIMSLESPLLSSRIATIEFLLVITTSEYPKGHKLVMESLDHFRILRGGDHKVRIFDFLVKSLKELVDSRGVFGSKVKFNAPEHHVGAVFSFMTEKATQPSEREIRNFLVK